MSLRLRAGIPGDIGACASICHAAFEAIADRHNFPPDFPSREPAEQLIASLLARDDIYSVVAETDGRVVGSNFLWETAPIAGVGPITVDPTVQDGAVGRRLMEDVLERARVAALRRRAPGPGRVPQPLAGALRQARVRCARAAGEPPGPGPRPRGPGLRRRPADRGRRRSLRRTAPAAPRLRARRRPARCDRAGHGDGGRARRPHHGLRDRGRLLRPRRRREQRGPQGR